MGFIDAFTKEDRIEITVSQMYELLKEAARADLFRNGVKNKVPYEHILQVMDGNADALAQNEPIWRDAKIDPPKEPGMYYGRKDDTNSMFLCDYRDGKWTLRCSALSTPQEMDIMQWAEYTAFSSSDNC